MKEIYREIRNPDHTVCVIKRDANGISYEDGHRIVCTRRIVHFEKKFRKDIEATMAEIVAGFRPQTKL